MWILGAPPSRGMTRQILLIARSHRSRGAPLRPSVAKPCHVKREGRGGHGKRGVVPLFLCSLRPFRQIQKTIKRKGVDIKEYKRGKGKYKKKKQREKPQKANDKYTIITRVRLVKIILQLQQLYISIVKLSLNSKLLFDSAIF